MTNDVVGRDDELALIGDFLGGREQLPAVLVIAGAAGIGKTTLWRAGIRCARDLGYRVLQASASPSETQLSFAGLGDLLGDHVDEILPSLPAPRQHALSVALLLTEPEGRPPEPRTIDVAFLEALRYLARETAVLLAVDDVQWLDRSSAAALAFAGRRLRNDPIALLVAQRIDGTEDLPLELDRAPFSPAEVRRTELGPLSLGALHRLLHARLGIAFSRPTLLRIRATSGGNPFFALEVGRALERRGMRIGSGEQLPVPDNLLELVHDRIDALPAGTRELLAFVAALSRPTLGSLQAAVGDGDLWSMLSPALEAQVLERDHDSIRFTHPLLSSAVETDVDPVRRRLIHRRLADVLPDLEERAGHVALATEAPDREAAHLLEQAAHVAAGRGASAAAAELAELAAELTPPGDAAERRRRLVMAGEQFFTAGENRRAEELFEECLAETRSGAERADLLFKLSLPRGEDDSKAGLDLKDQALREPGVEDRLRASILLIRSEELWLRLELEAAALDAREALEIAERLGDPALLVPAVVHVPLIEFMRGNALDREQIEAQIALESSFANPTGYWTPSMVLGSSLVFLDRPEEARPVLLAEYERGLARNNEVEHGRAAFYLAELELRAGNWKEAERYSREALDVVEQMGARANVGRYLYCTALVDAHLGRIDEARAAVESGLTLAGGLHESTRVRHLTVLGFIETSLERHEQALEHIGSLAHVLAGRGVGEPGAFLYEADELTARIALGQLDAAEARIEAIEKRGRRLDRPRELVYAYRGRGLLLAARGDLDGARSFLARALAEHERLPVPFERGRTLLGLGQVQRRAREKRQARDTLEHALAIFEELGAPLWAEKARTELARIGGRPAAREGALTETERRVAELVAEGRSNKEVAAALFVTAKTVETNLLRIYRKLDVHSRAALAHKLAQLGDAQSHPATKL